MYTKSFDEKVHPVLKKLSQIFRFENKKIFNFNFFLVNYKRGNWNALRMYIKYYAHSRRRNAEKENRYRRGTLIGHYTLCDNKIKNLDNLRFTAHKSKHSIGRSQHIWIREKKREGDIERNINGRDSNPPSILRVLKSRSKFMCYKLIEWLDQRFLNFVFFAESP